MRNKKTAAPKGAVFACPFYKEIKMCTQNER